MGKNGFERKRHDIVPYCARCHVDIVEKFHMDSPPPPKISFMWISAHVKGTLTFLRRASGMASFMRYFILAHKLLGEPAGTNLTLQCTAMGVLHIFYNALSVCITIYVCREKMKYERLSSYPTYTERALWNEMSSGMLCKV